MASLHPFVSLPVQRSNPRRKQRLASLEDRGVAASVLTILGRQDKTIGKFSTDPNRNYYGMKKLAATIALLCVSNAVLAHDIYSNLRDRDGHLCCGGQDCKPVKAITLPNGSYYLPETDEAIPADMATPSPDSRFHHCTYYRMTGDFDRWGGPIWEDKPKTRCFFAPMNSW